MTPGLRTTFTVVVVVCSLFLACSKSQSGAGNQPDAGSVPSGLGVGELCQNSNQCRAGLLCGGATKTCAPGGNVIQGGHCYLSGECTTGNYCAQAGTCAPSGKGIAGDVCSSEGDCAAGLLCAQTGLTGTCAPAGTGDLNRACQQTTDCMAGLLCITAVCAKAVLSQWSGVACPAEDTIPRIYFHVPRAGDPTGNTDFYRLPFPNDIRIKNGKVSLSGHPRPGPTILPFDIVDRYISAIESELTGFGANQAIYVRFSKAFNPASFPGGGCNADIVDITPTSPTYTFSAGFTCEAVSSSTPYICGPFMWVRPPLGSPLRPRTTYAMIVKTGIKDMLGAAFAQDDDFAAMLAATPPADPDVAAAYPAYQPLRDYIAAGKIAASDLAVAAVFTVQKYEDPLAAIATAVAAAAAPTVEGMVRCGDLGAVSPCDDGKTGADHLRGCLAADSASSNFDEYQGTISLPVLQQGTAPYLTPGDGGGIVYDATGAATIQSTQKVCFALTVPKGAAPAAGWPLVVYGHGTGGSYRSIVDLGLSDDLAQGAVPAGVGVDGGASATAVPMAMLGYDGILHGTRNGGSTKPVGELVYNFLNPVAARDNALQAAADLVAIPRGLAGLAAPEIEIDGTRLALYGHSQGGNGASLVAARQSSYGAIVMSGTGGTLIFTLLEKTQPINIPAVLPYLLGAGSAAQVDASHPVLNLMQMYFERSDSVNFARRLFHEPLPDMTAHHILHVYGTQDSYSVVDTQRDYALAASFHVALPIVDDFGLKGVAPPVNDNEYFGSYGKLTAVEIQYQPTGRYDGHFVSTQNPAARKAIQDMLVTFARDGVPTVSP